MKQLELFADSPSPSETKGEVVDTSALDLAVEDALYQLHNYKLEFVPFIISSHKNNISRKEMLFYNKLFF